MQDLVDGARRDVGSGTAPALVVGLLAGLTAPVPERARMLAAEAESSAHHAGYLLGRFLSWVESTGRILDEDLVLTASTYFSSISMSGDQGRWDPSDPRLGAHTFGMVAAERQRGKPVPVAAEALLVSWISAHLRMKPLDSAGHQLAARRAQRHAKLFGLDEGPDANTPM